MLNWHRDICKQSYALTGEIWVDHYYSYYINNRYGNTGGMDNVAAAADNGE